MRLNERFIGIDGGGTKTTCAIGTADGRVLAIVSGASSNIQSKPLSQVVNVITGLIEEALDQSDSEFTQLTMVYMALAGSAREEDRKKIMTALQKRMPALKDYVIDHDAKGALAAGTWHETGMVLIAGTGSIVYAFQSPEEEPIRVGGWGYLLGDEGSGFDIGRKGISAVMKEYDRTGTATRLTDFVLEHFGKRDPSNLIPTIYGAKNVRGNLASVAKVVFLAAEGGDKVAKDILKGAKEDLVRLVEAAYRQMPDTSSQTLVVSGGVFQNRLFRESFEADIREQLNGLTLIYPKLSPVIGALTLALKQAGIQLTDDVKKTLEHYRIDSNKGGMNSSGSA